MRREKSIWLPLMIPLLALSVCSCDSSDPAPVPEEVNKGLSQDTSVDLSWPDSDTAPARIKYYNVISDGASWLAPEEVMALRFPKAVAVDKAAKNLYFTDRYGVKHIELETGRMGYFTRELVDPFGIDVADNGDVYIIDRDQVAVVVYSQSGNLLKTLDFGDVFINPIHITIDDERSRFYVTDSKANEASVWSLDGEYLYSLQGSEEVPIALPIQVAISSKGEAYLLHHGKQKVMVYSSEGELLRSFGDYGTWPTQFVNPKGIAIDSDDNIYISDSAHGNFQIFNSADQLCLWVGEGGNDLGQFNLPKMMTIDSQDRIFTVEYGTNRVQIFQYLKANQ